VLRVYKNFQKPGSPLVGVRFVPVVRECFLARK